MKTKFCGEDESVEVEVEIEAWKDGGYGFDILVNGRRIGGLDFFHMSDKNPYFQFILDEDPNGDPWGYVRWLPNGRVAVEPEAGNWLERIMFDDGRAGQVFTGRNG